MTITYMPVVDLDIDHNIRSTVSRAAIDGMKASILANGVIQNVTAALTADGSRTVVIAGITRTLAAQELVGESKLATDFAIPVAIKTNMVAGDVDSIALALTENLMRSEMDYTDTCQAMLMLARGGKSEEDIGALFGYRKALVRERILIAKIVPEALDLVRAKTRNLDWARAMTIADIAFQKSVMQDIATNPNAWKTAEDIRNHINRATIPVSHAIFDPKDYKGQVVSDFFDGDKLSDVQEFWDLQNKAIDNLAVDLEGKGYSKVSIIRGEAFADWKYEHAPKGQKGEAFIEVLATGAVRTLCGYVEITQGNHQSLEGALHQDETAGGIAAWELRATPRVMEYAAAHKSAMVQAKVGSGIEEALRYSILSLMGVSGATISAQPLSFALKSEARDAATFRASALINDQVESITNAAQAAQSRDEGMVMMVMSMTKPELEHFFTLLVAQRAGQKKSSLDKNAHSLVNVFGQDIDVRATWTPGEEFFNLVPTDDMRRLAAWLIPGNTPASMAHVSRKRVSAMLTQAFQDAKDGGVYDSATNTRINAWVPGIMSFPGVIETGICETGESIESAEDALFGGF